MRQTLFRFFGWLFIERPAARQSLETLTQALEQGGSDLERRVANARDDDENRIQLRHIIGIERWGQRRLRVALGAPFVQDEYDNYRPQEATPWVELREELRRTRRETVAIARTLDQVGVRPDTTVPHNDFGELSLRGWLRYLNTHAELESRRLKG
ncbi:MAG: DinB family protein [Chloroflexaceae bacterium]|jgi:hypothetical protein|nr:DinB family protein [Chloroflexaceae bacterium]